MKEKEKASQTEQQAEIERMGRVVKREKSPDDHFFEGGAFGPAAVIGDEIRTLAARDNPDDIDIETPNL